ncbi:DUF2496 domain-containing protein [Thalassotalea litorea]|uniref:DUF2496 domain-containing protein n=1 Tax=Thalassotalea litorea TaxID=2020715 RepID=UPI003735AB06
MSLENAPKHVQLAVDLIQLLEENAIPPETALKAIKLVAQDCQNQLRLQQGDDQNSQ